MSKETQVPSAAASPATRSAEQTRQALIAAALKLFGEQGFEGTSTRQIAAEANANIASIAYHFGGKEGLRLACAEHIVGTLRSISGAVLAASPDPATLKPDTAAGVLRSMIAAMLRFFFAQQQAGTFVQFVLRELSHPTAALDVIYNGLFAPLHARLCQIWAVASGEDAESDAAKLSVFTLIGQVVYFRIAREAVLRRMEWTNVGEREAEAIIAAVTFNFDSMLAARLAPGSNKDKGK